MLDCPEGCEAGWGDRQQVGPAVPAVRLVGGVTVVGEHVGEAMDALAGLTHLSGDVGDCCRVVLDCFEHEPAGERLTSGLCERLTGGAAYRRRRHRPAGTYASLLGCRPPSGFRAMSAKGPVVEAEALSQSRRSRHSVDKG